MKSECILLEYVVWLLYLIRSFVCMDIPGASYSEAFSIFVTVIFMKGRFMVFSCFVCVV